VDHLEGGLTKLAFTKLRVEVYLRAASGVAIHTYSRRFVTAAGIGPCSPARDFNAAFGKQVRKLKSTGPVTLYRFGNLVFRIYHSRVGAVTLGKGAVAAQVAGNSLDCSG
jgi:hypothetical protein